MEPAAPARTAPSTVALDAYARRWGWFFTVGLLLLVAGALALSATVVATFATVLFFGGLVFAAGVVQVAAAFAAHGWRGFSVHLIVGLTGVVIGLLLIVRPLVGASALTFLFAALFFVSGAARLVHAVSERFDRWGWTAASGGVSVVLGVWLVAEWPLASLWFLGMLLGIELLFAGATWLGVSLLLRRTEHARPAVLAS